MVYTDHALRVTEDKALRVSVCVGCEEKFLADGDEIMCTDCNPRTLRKAKAVVSVKVTAERKPRQDEWRLEQRAALRRAAKRERENAV
jgi:DNA-directed RNA polymerase subunit RPC12/RpoP